MELDSRLVEPGSEDYPAGLEDLAEPPPIYVAGTMLAAPAVAVVGTRRCTRYGVDLAMSFGATLARSGWSVVSGMARGIDAAAHWGTLDGRGHAVGVLATGLDVWYPAENRRLYQALLDAGGVLISEYPETTRPDRWRFPARNRLIAAVASAVVVVEAGMTGGALITARLSAEMGRAVFVVPGDVDRPASVGCNMLIRDGAHPVLGAADLIEELSLVLGEPRPPIGQPTAELPASGVQIEDLPSFWRCSVGEALRRVGRMEAEGSLRRDGETVYPPRG